MKLYLITRTGDFRFDAYHHAVVAAESADDARRIHPNQWSEYDNNGNWTTECSDWVKITDIGQLEVEYLGETNKERGLILGEGAF